MPVGNLQNPFVHPQHKSTNVHSAQDGHISLSQTSGFTLGFEEAEDVVFPNGALYVSDDGAGSIVDELNADLSHTTSRSGSSENSRHLDELDRLLACVHDVVFGFSVFGRDVGGGLWTGRCLS